MDPQLHDAYAELGLRPGASDAQVKAAWRRLVSRWHPDRNDSAVAVGKMQRVNLAFTTIRAAAVGEGEAEGASEARPGRAAGGENGEDGENGEAPPQDARTAHAARGGRVIARKLKLGLDEAAFGCTKVLQGQLTDTCAACAGRGHRVLGGDCGPCGGSGRVLQRQWYGLFGSPQPCEACAGTGEGREPCAACEGAGKLPPRKYRVSVRIPAGVREGDLLQVDGRRLRPGQPQGGLQLRVEIVEHPLFRLGPQGELHGEVPVDGFDWLAERSIELPLLDRSLHSLRLQRGCLSHRLPGQGYPRERRGARGDLVLTLRPVFPKPLDADLQILVDRLCAVAAAAGPTALAPELRDWQRRVRAWSRARRAG